MDLKLARWIRDISGEQHDARASIRLIRASGLQLFILIVGTLGYHILTEGEYGLLHCMYMTVITLTTVGFGEVIPIRQDPALEIFTIGLIITGMGTVLYFVSSMTAFIVDGELRDVLRTRKVNRMLENMSNHFIIAGVGETGQYVLTEMAKSDKDTVVIDMNQASIRHLQLDYGFDDLAYLIGDATDDDVLRKAGIDRASGVVFSLGTDKDNLFATITARRLNPKIRIVTRGEDPRAEQKFIMAGATSVIYTNVLGGMRMAAEVVRPEVTTFLDLMMSAQDARTVEELEICETSPWVGRTLRDLNIRDKTDALIIAVHMGDDYLFNPAADFKLEAGAKLILMSRVDDVPVIERLLRG